MERAREQCGAPAPPPAAPVPDAPYDRRRYVEDIKLSIGLLSQRNKKIEDLIKDADIKANFRQVANDCMQYINFLNAALHPDFEDGMKSLNQSKTEGKVPKESPRKPRAEKAAAEAPRACTAGTERAAAASSSAKQGMRSTSLHAIDAVRTKTSPNMAEKPSQRNGIANRITLPKGGPQRKILIGKNITSTITVNDDCKGSKESTVRGSKVATSINNPGKTVTDKNKMSPATAHRTRMRSAIIKKEEPSEEDDPEKYLLNKNNKIKYFNSSQVLRNRPKTTDKVSIQHKTLMKIIDSGKFPPKDKTERKCVISKTPDEVSEPEADSNQMKNTPTDDKFLLGSKEGVEREKYLQRALRANVFPTQDVLPETKKVLPRDLPKEGRVDTGRGTLPRSGEVSRSLRALLDARAAGDGSVARPALDPVPPWTSRSSRAAPLHKDPQPVSGQISRSTKMRSKTAFPASTQLATTRNNSPRSAPSHSVPTGFAPLHTTPLGAIARFAPSLSPKTRSTPPRCAKTRSAPPRPTKTRSTPPRSAKIRSAANRSTINVAERPKTTHPSLISTTMIRSSTSLSLPTQPAVVRKRRMVPREVPPPPATPSLKARSAPGPFPRAAVRTRTGDSGTSSPGPSKKGTASKTNAERGENGVRR